MHRSEDDVCFSGAVVVLPALGVNNGCLDPDFFFKLSPAPEIGMEKIVTKVHKRFEAFWVYQKGLERKEDTSHPTLKEPEREALFLHIPNNILIIERLSPRELHTRFN